MHGSIEDLDRDQLTCLFRCHSVFNVLKSPQLKPKKHQKLRALVQSWLAFSSLPLRSLLPWLSVNLVLTQEHFSQGPWISVSQQELVQNFI